MGTNYYVKENICKYCGRGDELIHLGKDSWGWAFTIQANGFVSYKDWNEMKKWLKGKHIENEYGDYVSVKEFIEIVESKRKVKDPRVDYDRGQKPVSIKGYKFYDCEFS